MYTPHKNKKIAYLRQVCAILETQDENSTFFLTLRFYVEPFLAKMFLECVNKKGYLNDLERGLMDGDRRPSSSIKLGFESFDEK